MIYRILPPEEFEAFRPFSERNGVPMPAEGRSIVAVAEKDGQIVYCHMAHMQLHLDNMCRDKDFKGYFDYRKPGKLIEEMLPRPAVVYTYPSFENGVRMAEICGYHKAPYPTMIKELK